MTQEIHRRRCYLMNALHNDKEELAQKDREVAKLIDETRCARIFLQAAVPYLRKICSHEWRADFLGGYYCKDCGKSSENRPSDYREEDDL